MGLLKNFMLYREKQWHNHLSYRTCLPPPVRSLRIFSSNGPFTFSLVILNMPEVNYGNDVVEIFI